MARLANRAVWESGGEQERYKEALWVIVKVGDASEERLIPMAGVVTEVQEKTWQRK